MEVIDPFPVLGIPAAELVRVLAVVESADFVADKRILSLTVRSDGSVVVKTGEILGGLNGRGDKVVLEYIDGNWSMTESLKWAS